MLKWKMIFVLYYKYKLNKTSNFYPISNIKFVYFFYKLGKNDKSSRDELGKGLVNKIN